LDVSRATSSDILLRVYNSGSGGAKMRFVANDGIEAQYQWTHTNAWTAAIVAADNVANQHLNYMAFRVRNAADANTEAGLNAATRLTITGLGNFGFNGTDYGGGSGVLALKDASTAPTTNPTGGHILYSQAGALKGRGSSGTVTTIAASEPHCQRCGADFVLEWENPEYGGRLAVCFKCLTVALAKAGIMSDDYAIATPSA
jgi:hypothetical protein